MRKRLIPVLTIDRDRRLVKTIQFGERTYVGDPFNVVRLFNEKEVDEICVLDIDATVDGRSPDLGFMGELASECFMPLAYGGGISEMSHCEQLNRIGVEKIVLGHAALDLDFVRAVSRSLGSQAVVACVDVKGSGDVAICATRSASLLSGRAPLEYCLSLQQAGVGEIILQSVDRDGLRAGCDLPLISKIAPRLDVPVVSLGGHQTMRTWRKHSQRGHRRPRLAARSRLSVDSGRYL
jgi:imidazole glycerol-phosphate synthase subunit HisF